jgi:serine/threonine protein kinase
VDRYVVEDLVVEGGTAAITARHAKPVAPRAQGVRAVFDSLRQRTRPRGASRRIRHPNLVPVTDIISIHDVPALVMDFVDGPTLEDWLTSGSARSTSSTRSRGNFGVALRPRSGPRAPRPSRRM